MTDLATSELPSAISMQRLAMDLEDWKYPSPLPATVTLPALESRLTQAQSRLTAATSQEVAKALSMLRKLFSPPKDFDATTVEIYQTMLDLPADLLVEATRRACQNNKFFPKPAELRELVSTELRQRKRDVQHTETALMVARRL